MPFHKRRKLSLDNQDGKESERNGVTSTSGEGKTGRLLQNTANSNKIPSTAQYEKRSAKSDRKGDHITTLACEDDHDGTVSGTTDSFGRVSSSGRIIKQTVKGKSFSAAVSAAQSKPTTTGSVKVTKTGTPVRGRRKKKRPWEVWSNFEKDTFFEGLFEYGKDFDAIQNLIAHRSKKRGIDAAIIKNKDQVRYFYYRNWQKIAKHVQVDEEVKKETHELYGLINYAALRKAFKGLNERSAVHLNELIHTGVSKVKETVGFGKRKKKITRILRTPICNALKKLNNIEESKEEAVDMPEMVTVEMTPRTCAGWLKVQNLSQNPRVRFNLSVNRSLSSVIQHLQKKWKGPNDRLRSSICGDEEREELVVFPHHSYTLTPITLAPQRATSVNMITYSTYRENILDSPNAGNKIHRKSVDDPKQVSDTSSDADLAPFSELPNTMKSNARISLFQQATEPPPTGQLPLPEPIFSNDDENAMFPDVPLSSSPAKDSDFLKLESNTNNAEPSVGSDCENNNVTGAGIIDGDQSPQSKEKRDIRDEERETDMHQLIDSAQKGFTQETSKLVTLAQLLLMLDRTAHIRLEYEWQTKRPGPSTVGNNINSINSVGMASETERLSNMLRRLANLATLEYKARQAASGHMSQCTLCGHQLERSSHSSRSKIRSTNDVATETDALYIEELIPGSSNVVRPTKLNSNGTIVGISTNFISGTKELTPDTDGVFRVPMPLPLVRHSGQQRMTAQPSVSQLIRPPEPRLVRPNFMIPRKRKQQRKPIIVQRTLLPKMTTGPVMTILPTTDALVHSLSPQTVIMTHAPVVSSSASLNQQPLSTLVTSNSVSGGSLDLNTSDLFSSSNSMPIITSSPAQTTSAQHVTHSSISPPSLSSFLDISLPAPSGHASDAGDKFLDMVLVNGNSGFTGFLKSPIKQEHHNPSMNNTLSTPPHSPRSSPLKLGAEAQWLSGESQDLSLGGLLDTPVKKSEVGDSSSRVVPLISVTSSSGSSSFLPIPPILFGDNSQDFLVTKLDVDTLQSVMTESSVDYSCKFEKLAAHLADNADSTQPGM